MAALSKLLNSELSPWRKGASLTAILNREGAMVHVTIQLVRRCHKRYVETGSIHSKNRTVVLTINLLCWLQMSEPIWCMDTVNCQDGMITWRKVGWEWGKDCHVVLLHKVMTLIWIWNNKLSVVMTIPFYSVARRQESGRPTLHTALLQTIEDIMQADDEAIAVQIRSYLLQRSQGWHHSAQFCTPDANWAERSYRGSAYCQLIRQANKENKRSFVNGLVLTFMTILRMFCGQMNRLYN